MRVLYSVYALGPGELMHIKRRHGTNLTGHPAVVLKAGFYDERPVELIAVRGSRFAIRGFSIRD